MIAPQCPMRRPDRREPAREHAAHCRPSIAAGDANRYRHGDFPEAIFDINFAGELA